MSVTYIADSLSLSIFLCMYLFLFVNYCPSFLFSPSFILSFSLRLSVCFYNLSIWPPAFSRVLSFSTGVNLSSISSSPSHGLFHKPWLTFPTIQLTSGIGAHRILECLRGFMGHDGRRMGRRLIINSGTIILLCLIRWTPNHIIPNDKDSYNKTKNCKTGC